MLSDQYLINSALTEEISAITIKFIKYFKHSCDKINSCYLDQIILNCKQVNILEKKVWANIP